MLTNPYVATSAYQAQIIMNLWADMDLWLWAQPPIRQLGEIRPTAMFLGLPGTWFNFERVSIST